MMKQTITFLLVVALSFLSSLCFANTRLQQVQSQIEHVKNLLSWDQGQQTSVQHNLKKIETNIGNLAVANTKVQQSLTQQRQQLTQLNQQQKYYQQQLQQQETTLAEQMRAAYMLGQQPYFKLVVNAENPTDVGRFYTYLHYINQKRLQSMQQWQQTLEQLQQNQQAIQTHQQKLMHLQQQQQTQQQQMLQEKQQRQQLLVNLNNQMQSHQQQLQTLLANKQALEDMIHHLTESSEKINNNFWPKHTGKFPWPTRGRITENFGAPIEQSQLRTTGVLITAPEGQNVYAIAPGRVAYANWMAGYGLLMIIDHGNGLMSIYGRNHSLFKKVGDTVKTGDVIASIGDSGGFTQTALYFGLRQDGKPINPESYCG